MKLNYKVYGEGRPVVILHGLFGMLDNWQTFAKQLMADYKVILVDQRNHGRSPQSEEFAYPLLAADLNELLEDMGIDSTVLIGHSMGGKAAIQTAHDFPNKISKLMVVDITAKTYSPGHLEIFEAVLSLDIANLSNRREADEHLSTKIDNIGVRQFLLKNLSRHPEGGYRWKANFQVLHDRYDNMLSSPDLHNVIDVETLFVRGEKSGYITVHDEVEIQEQFSNAQVKSINAGHWIHAEKPKELLEMVDNFLED